MTPHDAPKPVRAAPLAAITTYFLKLGALGKVAIGDWVTASIALLSLAALFRWKKLPNPALIWVTALIGLMAFPLLNPNWVMIH